MARRRRGATGGHNTRRIPGLMSRLEGQWFAGWYGMAGRVPSEHRTLRDELVGERVGTGQEPLRTSQGRSLGSASLAQTLTPGSGSTAALSPGAAHSEVGLGVPRFRAGALGVTTQVGLESAGTSTSTGTETVPVESGPSVSALRRARVSRQMRASRWSPDRCSDRG